MEQLDETQRQSVIAGAQRLQNDEILTFFLREVRGAASHFTVFDVTAEMRELHRAKVMAVDELCGHIALWATWDQDRLVEEERAKAFE
jgi:hypothetical protein